MSAGTLGSSTLGGAYDPETGYRQVSPQLLMAQQLMKLEEPKVNATQSSFWANLLNQGLRGGLAGYLTNEVTEDQKKAREAENTQADKAMGDLDRIMRGGGAAAPQPDAAPATPDQGFDTPDATMPGTSGSAAPAGPGAIPAAQRGDIVNQAVAGTKVPPQVLAALIEQESRWKPRAVGKAGDGGLGQIIPSTAARPGYGVAPISTADIADPVKNASFTARYLEGRGRAAGLATPEDWQDPAKLALALKAYNGGGDPNYVANVTRFMPRGTQVASSNPGLAPETGAPAPPASPFDAGMPQLGPDASGGVQVASNAPDAPALGAPAPPSPAVAGDVAAIQAGMQQARTGAPAGTQVADAGASPFAGAGIELPPTRGQAMAAPLAPGGAPGQSAPTGAALAGRLLQPGQIDGLYRLSDEWAGSTNPLLRARAAGVRAQAERAEAQLNAHSNRQATLAAQRDAARERAAEREATRVDRERTHAESAADRRERTAIEQERLKLQQQQNETGRLQPGYTWGDPSHTTQTPIRTPDGSTVLQAKANTEQDLKLLDKGKWFVPGSDRTEIGPIPGYSNGRFDFSKDPTGVAWNALNVLGPQEASGNLSADQKNDLTTARGILTSNPSGMHVGGPNGPVQTTRQLPSYGENAQPGTQQQPAQPDAQQQTRNQAAQTGTGRQLAPGAVEYPATDRDVPQSENEKLLTHKDILTRVNTTIDSLEKNKGAVGLGQGMFPNATKWFDKDQGNVATRAMVGDLQSMINLARSGQAVSQHEAEVLQQFVPNVGDPYENAMTKLRNFQQQYRSVLSDHYEIYGPGNRYTKNAPVERTLLATPMRLPENDDEAQRTFDGMQSGQVFIGPDGKRRRKP